MKRENFLSLNRIFFLAGIAGGLHVIGWAYVNPSCPACEALAQAQLQSATLPLGALNPDIPTRFSTLMNVASIFQPALPSVTAQLPVGTAAALQATAQLQASGVPAPFNPGLVLPTYSAAAADPTGGALKLATSVPMPPSPFGGSLGDSWWVSSTVPGLIFYNPGPSYPSFFPGSFQFSGPSFSWLGLRQFSPSGTATAQGPVALMPAQTAVSL